MAIDAYPFRITIKLGIPLIVYGENTNEDAVKLAKEEEWVRDRGRSQKDFIDFCGDTEAEFRAIAERFVNHEIVEKRDGGGRLTVPGRLGRVLLFSSVLRNGLIPEGLFVRGRDVTNHEPPVYFLETLSRGGSFPRETGKRFSISNFLRILRLIPSTR